MQLGGGGDSLAHAGVCAPPARNPVPAPQLGWGGAQELLPCSLEPPGSSQSALRKTVLGFQVLNTAQKALKLAWVTQQLGVKSGIR